MNRSGLVWCINYADTLELTRVTVSNCLWTFVSTPLSFQNYTVKISTRLTSTVLSLLLVSLYAQIHGQVAPPQQQPCSPISALACGDIGVDLPFALTFDGTGAGIAGTGFTMVDAPFVNQFPGTPSEPDIPGLESDLLAVSGGRLVVTSTKGINYESATGSTGNNTQVNALGVGLAPTGSPFSVQVDLAQPDYANRSSGNSEQGGLWYGIDGDNFVKLVVIKSGPTTQAIQLLLEHTDPLNPTEVLIAKINARALPIDSELIRLRLAIDPIAGEVSGYYSIDGVAEVRLGSTDDDSIDLPVALLAGTDHDGQPGTEPLTFAGIFGSHRRAPAARSLDFAFDNFVVAADPTDLSLSFSREDVRLTAARQGLEISQEITLSASDGGSPNVTLSDDPAAASWLILPTDPQVGTISLGVRGGLAVGTYTTTVFALADGYATAQLSVTATVTEDGAVISLSPESFAIDGTVGVTGEPLPVRVSNSGSGSLVGFSADLSGPDADAFSVAALSADTLAVDGSESLRIRFTPTREGVHEALLTVRGDNLVPVTLTLRGLGKGAGVSSREPSLQYVFDTYGLGIDVGDEDPTTDRLDLAAGADYSDLLGDEIAAQSFRKASADEDVSLEVLAVYGPQANDPIVGFGWYPSGQPTALSELLTVSNAIAGNGQTLRPVTTGSLSFDPGNVAFGLYSRWPFFDGQEVFSEDALNTFSGAIPHHVRVYALAEEDNAYVVATEEYTCDFGYQDIVVIVRNVTPAQPETPEALFTDVNPGDGSVDVPVTGFQITAPVATPAGYELNKASLNGSVKLFEQTSEGFVEVDANANDTGGGDAVTLTPAGRLKALTTYRFRIEGAEANKIGEQTERIPFRTFTSQFTTVAEADTSALVDLKGVSFTQVRGSELGEGISDRFSSLVIGPDGKLYATTLGELIRRWTIRPDGTLADPEDLVVELTGARNPDSGQNNPDERLIIGLTFAPGSTAENLVAYITHSALTFSGGPTWDGKLTRVSGPTLGTVEDILVHLPRSAKDHLTNSVVVGPGGDLFLTQGSNSAGGAPDIVWNLRSERLLTAAALRVELDKLPATLPLSLYTTDDISVINAAPTTGLTMSDGTYNPYSEDSPVTIYASGVRNAYDLVFHSNGWTYVPANGTAGNRSTSPNSPASAEYVTRDSSGLGVRRPDGRFAVDPTVPGLAGGETQKDWLFKTKGGTYHGHPNPYRGEFILNHGGRAYSGLPGQERSNYRDVSKYPTDLGPDVNYREVAYDFGFNKSPNGVIEYASNAFGGRLKGMLLVTRFSGQDDVMLLQPGNNSGDIVQAFQDVPGLQGLDDPLDVIEDPRTGNLYVSEYDSNFPGSPQLVLMRADVQDGPPVDQRVLSFTRSAIVVSAQPGGVSTKQGSSLTANAEVEADAITLRASESWVVLPVRLALDQPLQFAADASGLPAGEYEAFISAAAYGFTSDTLTLRLTVREGLPNTVRINFQDNSFTPPSGYTADVGLAYGGRGNGLTFGWIDPQTGAPLANTIGARGADRGATNQSTDAEKLLRSLNHFDLGARDPLGPHSWELALENGTYRVEVGSGDPRAFDSQHSIRAEDTTLIDGFVGSSANYFATTSDTVRVRDGRLTLDGFGAPGTRNTKILYVNVALLALDESGAELRVENRTKVPGTERAFPADDYITFHRLGDPVNRRGLTLKTPNRNVVRLHNDGTGVLEIRSVTTSDTNVFRVITALDGLTIEPGDFVDATIEFVGPVNGRKGISTERLVFDTNTYDEGRAPVTLRGAYSVGPEGSLEINVQEVFRSFGFATELGRDAAGKLIVSPSSDYPTDEEVNSGQEGDMILSPFFVQADASEPLRMFQLSALHGPGGAPSELRLANGSVAGGVKYNHGGLYHQTLLPRLTDTSTEIAGDFVARLTDSFEIVIAGYRTSGGTAANTRKDELLGVRVYRAIDRDGNVIPNEYIVNQDYIANGCGRGSANCDWNDNTSYIINARPVGVPTASGLEDQVAVSGQRSRYTVADSFDLGYPGNRLLYSAELVDGGELPDWIELDAATGTFTFAPPAGALGQVADIAVTATDYNLLTTSAIFSVSVDGGPRPIGMPPTRGGVVFGDAASVSVFPNPAPDQVTLDISSEHVGPVVVRLIDVNGRRLSETTFRKVGTALRSQIEVGNLAPGIYRLQVIEDQRESILPFYKG